MDSEQVIKHCQGGIQYRFDLMRQVGDSLTIYGCRIYNVRNSAVSHCKRYGCVLSVHEIENGCIIKMIESRARHVRVSARQFYLEKLKAMKHGELITFPWHIGRGSSRHPAYRDVFVANRDRIEYLTHSTPDGLQVYRKKQA